ncbi:hypothetical protein OBK24_08025 [Empedobacter falsenii]
MLLLVDISMAQVGINTDSPRSGSALDVNGSMKASTVLLPENLPFISTKEKDTFVYLVQNQATGAVELLDLSVGGSGRISSILTYQLKNINKDWVLDFNTKINSTDYALVILSAWFDENLLGNNPAPPVARTKEINGTWHLEADYSAVASENNGTWYITCVVYPKNYAKIFSLQEIKMNNKSTSSATAAVINY